MAKSAGNCPLCDQQPAEQGRSARYLRDWYRCPRCGLFQIEDFASAEIARDHSPERHLISGVTRRAAKPLVIGTGNLSDLLASAPPDDFADRMNRVLQYVGDRQPRFDGYCKPDMEVDYPLVFTRGASEFKFILDKLVEAELLEDTPGGGAWRLSPAGWLRVGELRSARTDSGQAFVAIWFDKALEGAWEDGFEPAIKENGYDPLRVDLAQHNGKIDDYIVAEIQRSGLLVADSTGNRGGVYFEAGFAKGLGIPVIWTCHKDSLKALHFDTRQYNHIDWETPSDLRQRLSLRIAATAPRR